MSKRQNIKYLTEEEKKQLLRTLKLRKDGARAYMMYDLALNTGLRLSGLSSLSVGDVLDKKKLEINGKGDKVRDIPLNSAIRAHIEVFIGWKRRHEEDISPEAPLFISRNHRRLSNRQIERDLGKWLKVAGIEGHYSPHALRHTFGTELYGKTNNIRLVQELMGHADISTTQIYTAVTKEQMAAAVELLGK